MSIKALPVEEAAAITRLAALSPLEAGARGALAAAMQQASTFRAHREIIAEGREIGQALLVVSGWAARMQLLADGRRQIISIVLPGDLVGYCDQERPVASSSLIAITDVSVCAAPDPSAFASLKSAYSQSRARDEAYLLAQITRLGRMSAQERIADFLLELLERLELAGLAIDRGYHFPLTQEAMADTLGLTSVHVDRMLQILRRDGSLDLKGRDLILPNASALRRLIGRAAVRVTAA